MNGRDLLSRLLLLSLLLFCPLLEAGTAEHKALMHRALEQGLDTSNAWHALVYYKRHWLSATLASEADDERFFLSEQGKYSPRLELQATIAGFFNPVLDDDHPQCRFPARFQWLLAQLDIDRSSLPQPPCDGFATWFKQMDAAGVTLIFPASYLNSPSSMFGHSLIRFDQHQQTAANRILAFTANYAANAPSDDGGFVYAWRGLVGGYRGETTILPYYMKVKEYSDLESRDIWEYKLNLSQAETDQLLRHVWELRSINFDYYFFDENCSYRILGLFDVIRPQERMLEDYNLYAIPVDTIRKMYAQDFVDKVQFRASARTRLSHYLSQLSPSLQQIARQLVADEASVNENFERLSETQKSAVLEVAYEYSRFVNVKRDKAAKTSYGLLRLRQKVTAKSALSAPPTPSTRDDQGHLSARSRVLVGQRDEQSFVSLQVRPSYHDIIDPAPGFTRGSEIKFLELDLRHYFNNGDHQKEKTQVHEFSLAGIKSIRARDRFFSPLSWSVDIGAKRRWVEDHFALMPQVDGRMGYAYEQWGALFYGFVGGQMWVDSELHKGNDARLATALGLLWRGPATQILMEFNVDDSLVSADPLRKTFRYEQVINLPANWALKLQFSRENKRREIKEREGRVITATEYFSEFALGMHYYF